MNEALIQLKQEMTRLAEMLAAQSTTVEAQAKQIADLKAHFAAGVLEGGPLSVKLMETAANEWDVNVRSTRPTSDADPVFQKMKDCFSAISFDRFERFIDRAVYGTTSPIEKKTSTALDDWRKGFPGEEDAYKTLEDLADVFLRVEMGTRPEKVPPSPKPCGDTPAEAKAAARTFREACIEEALAGRSDAFKAKVKEAFGEIEVKTYLEWDADAKTWRYGVGKFLPGERLLCELIYCFFMEIGGVRQAEGAILLRYQNQQVVGNRGDALAQLNIESNDWLNSWLKGRIAGYQQRLLTSLPERANEYFAGIGLSVLPEEAAANPAEVHSRLVPALLGCIRRLLHYYDTVDNKFMQPDGTPVLYALKELQLAADEAEANRAYEMTFRLRKELLIAQAILGHPTLTRMLVSRTMVRRDGRYQAVVEAVKDALGWRLPDIAHYQDLAASSEMILAAAQVLPWVAIKEAETAASLAHFVRDEAKQYTHAYKAVAGVDLGIDETTLAMPSSILQVPQMAIAGRAGAQIADGNGSARTRVARPAAEKRLFARP